MIIRIADIPLEWQTDCAEFVREFACNTQDKPVMKLNFASQMNTVHGIQYTNKASAHILRLENSEFLTSDANWTDCTVFSTRGNSSEHSLPLAAICSRFAKLNALFMHASVIEYKGNGIIFAGYSGVGKTTQAELWKKHMHADIINGDKAFIRHTDNSFYIYGCPWKGSSEYCLNTKAGLKGIVILSQSAENKITKLDITKAIELFMPHIFLPHWDEKCLQEALNTLDKLLQEVPLWLLECRADEAAVKLTYSKVLNNGKI